MDFMNRGNRPVQQNTQTPGSSFEAPKAPTQKPSKFKNNDKLARFGFVGFVAAVTVLILAVVLSLAFSKDVGSKEFSKVDESKFQAVFLNGGQVYFGKIDDLNTKYLNMNNIYYLRVNQQVQPDQSNAAANPNDISLVKLGCELHGPEDSMVINREQVIFWENLKDDGQVAKAVAEYVKANPDGQKCDQQNAGGAGGNTNSSATPTTGNAPTNNATPAPTTTTPTTPAPKRP